MPSVLIAGETYSSNLGDGAIAENIAFLVNNLRPEYNVSFLDISARKGYGASSAQLEYKLGATGIQATPPRNYNLLKWLLVRQRRSQRRWKSLLDKTDHLIIGGGQLIMDNHLDFPLKLACLTDMARTRHIPYSILACGVGATWSPLAKHLVQKLLRYATSINVRDQTSQERLHLSFPGTSVTLGFDPAICSAAVFGKPPIISPRVGLGIIGMREVNVYGVPSSPMSVEQMLNFWIATVTVLQNAGYSVELFTNGSPSDQAMAKLIITTLTEQGHPPCALAPTPNTPGDLAQRIGAYSTVIAARLHANILATAYRVPAIGLAWDTKVKAFYERIHRAELCYDIRTGSPADLVAAVSTAHKRHVTQVELDQWCSEALTGVQAVLDHLGTPRQNLHVSH